MNTLPLDLLRLLDSFSDYGLRSTLSLNYEMFDMPVRCNNLKEAIANDNWCYINTDFYATKPSKFELVHEHTPLPTVFYKPSLCDLILKLDIIEKVTMFEIDPNYGPPHCLFSGKRLNKNSYMHEVGLLITERSTASITLPLITHTPIIYNDGKLRYQPVVGCICSSPFGSNFVVVECANDAERVLIAHITFINSSIVQYEYNADKFALHFDLGRGVWFGVHEYYEFDRFVLGNEIAVFVGPTGAIGIPGPGAIGPVGDIGIVGPMG